MRTLLDVTGIDAGAAGEQQSAVEVLSGLPCQRPGDGRGGPGESRPALHAQARGGAEARPGRRVYPRRTGWCCPPRRGQGPRDEGERLAAIVGMQAAREGGGRQGVLRTDAARRRRRGGAQRALVRRAGKPASGSCGSPSARSASAGNLTPSQADPLTSSQPQLPNPNPNPTYLTGRRQEQRRGGPARLQDRRGRAELEKVRRPSPRKPSTLQASTPEKGTSRCPRYGHTPPPTLHPGGSSSRAGPTRRTTSRRTSALANVADAHPEWRWRRPRLRRARCGQTSGRTRRAGTRRGARQGARPQGRGQVQRDLRPEDALHLLDAREERTR